MNKPTPADCQRILELDAELLVKAKDPKGDYFKLAAAIKKYGVEAIGIAEACPNILFLNLNEGWCYRTSSRKEWIGCINNDPLCDLNAMNEAEKELKDNGREWRLYGYNLAKVVDPGSRGYADYAYDVATYAHATAKQRADAFLLTLLCEGPRDGWYVPSL